MKVIHTDQAPAAVGPYSQAIEANGVRYCSGQIAINPAEGKIVATTIEEQAEHLADRLAFKAKGHYIAALYSKVLKAQAVFLCQFLFHKIEQLPGYGGALKKIGMMR